LQVKKLIFCLTVAVTISLASVGLAHADIVIVTGNNPQTDENVLLSTAGTGNPIFGITNQTQLSVRFSSSETLISPSNGQARIEASDSTLTNLTVDIPGATFTSLILNVDAATNGSINFIVTEDNGQVTQGMFLLDGSGQNFFTITAVNGQRIRSVAFTTTVGLTTTNVDDVAQIRIGGAQQTPIPEPTTMVLLGTGLIGMASKLRKRRNRKTKG
jgi:hypothetical protein